MSLQLNRQSDPGKYINLSQIYECRNWETEQYNSGLEITVSFLGKHKWEPEIYILTGPSCVVCQTAYSGSVSTIKFNNVQTTENSSSNILLYAVIPLGIPQHARLHILVL